MRRRAYFHWLMLAVTLGSSAARAGAVELTLARFEPRDDGCLCSIVHLTSGRSEEVAGLQFDLMLNPWLTELKDLTVGPAAADARKDLHMNRLDTQRVRVVMAGINQNAIADGLIATLCLRPKRALDPAAVLVGVEDLILSDPFGRPLAATIRVEQADGADIVAGSAGANYPLARKLAWMIVTVVALIILLTRMRPRAAGQIRSVRR